MSQKPSNASAQRLYVIELISYWEGKVNTTTLVEQFGISRQQASTDLKQYMELYPNNLQLSSTAKAHLATHDFVAPNISKDVVEYLNWIYSRQLPSQKTSHEALVLPSRYPITPLVMRALIEAVKKHKRVDVDYVSLSKPNGEGRIIAPHTFIKAGLRWHLRAWCEKNQRYSDFVLSRFRGESIIEEGKNKHTIEGDDDWNRHITLIFEPDSRLTPEESQVLETDYQMENGQLKIKTRACLAQYMIQAMQVNIKMIDPNPKAQQLVLVNLNDIQGDLFA